MFGGLTLVSMEAFIIHSLKPPDVTRTVLDTGDTTVVESDKVLALWNGRP